MSSFGKLEEFSPQKETITNYLERVEIFFLANAVADEKKVPVFLSVVGGNIYALLRSLLAPAKPQDKSFDALVAELKKHFEPRKVVIAERFNFHRRNQASGESIAEFVAELRRLSTNCDFGNYLEEALRDRFVCGLRSEATQKQLLTETDLTLARAVDIAKSMEAADKKTQQLSTSKKADSTEVNKLTRNSTPAQSCYRCGKPGHTPSTCRFKEAICRKCNKKGHIAKVCHSTNPHKASHRKTRQANWVENESEHSDSDLPIHKLSIRGTHPIKVKLQIQGKPVSMEVDTGAAVSVVSEDTYKELFFTLPLKRASVGLKTFTGEQIPILGEIAVEVCYQQQCHQLSLIVVKGKGHSLFGRDWLMHFQLDWKTIGLVTLGNASAKVNVLLKKYEEVFKGELGTIKSFRAKLHVKKDAYPVFLKPRSMPFAMKQMIEKELQRLEAEGIIEKVSHSKWAAPVVPVQKGDGKIRLCGDYKMTVNRSLEVDQYPLPKPEDLFASLTGGQKFSIIDLTQAYLQMELEDDSKEFVTINTHMGLYRYSRLPFGVASAPAIFQRTMDTILQGLSHVQCYIDDIIVTGTDDEEHIRNLEEVLGRLRSHGIRVKSSKCSFFQDSVEYLGHKITSEGLHTTTKKVDAIQLAPIPKNQRELRSFLGLLHYYGKFIPNLASLIYPLNSLLKANTPWNWTEQCEQAFKNAKQKLTSAAVLAHYDPNVSLHLAGDASAYGVGAVISHVYPDGSERPVAYASRTLSVSEKNYSQLEKEALSLIFGLRKFHQYLYGRRFTLVTDHQPLTTIFSDKKGVPSLAAARLQRWALQLSAHNYVIKFRPTKAHANADGLSRLPVKGNGEKENHVELNLFNICQIESLPLTSGQLKQATRTDLILSKVLMFTKTGWPLQISEALKPYWNRRLELSLEDGCILWGNRVVIPTKWQKSVLEELHQVHFGIARTKAIARGYVWWPELNEQIEEMTKSCTVCQKVKNAPAVAPLHPWTWPSRPWQRLHIDFAGPFQGQMFLIVVDSHSKWPEVVPMSKTTTDATIIELRRLFSSYGLPDQVVSDNGPQFVSEEFKSFLKSNGVKHIRCSPYHPSSNGAVERFVQTFKKAMLAQNTKLSFQQRLMSFLLTYRITPHTTTNVAPCTLFLNRDVKTRFDLMRPEISGNVATKQAKQKFYHDKHTKMRELFIGQRVMVRNLRPGDKWVPGTIIERTGPLSYLVQVGGGKTWKRHIDHLRQMSDSPQEEQMTETTKDSDTLIQFPTSHTASIPESGDGKSTPSVTESTPMTRRYPQRVRGPPDRLTYK